MLSRGVSIPAQQVVTSREFDLERNALETCARLFDRYYGEPERRVEDAIDSHSTRLPLEIRTDTLLELGASAVVHEDPRKALEIAVEVRALLDSAPWLPERFIPIEARLAALRFRAGALRPGAEAHHAMGDGAAALATYTRVVEEGVVNPNSRPRAEDFVATCLSLARNGVEPDKELWGRLEKVLEGLGAPW